jgi:hypothetical protein
MNYFFPEGKISKDHGRLIKIGDYWVYPIYHPAAALRNPTMMRDFVKDFMHIPNVLKEIEKKTNEIKPESSLSSKDQPALGL